MAQSFEYWFPFLRLFENKMKELEKDNAQKTSSLSELRQQLRQASATEERAQHAVRQLEDQVRPHEPCAGPLCRLPDHCSSSVFLCRDVFGDLCGRR